MVFGQEDLDIGRETEMTKEETPSLSSEAVLDRISTKHKDSLHRLSNVDGYGDVMDSGLAVPRLSSGLLCDEEIQDLAFSHDMIRPFSTRVDKGISYGLSSYGYDARVGDTFEVFDPDFTEPMNIDPKAFRMDLLQGITGDCTIPPNSFALSHTVETFKIPRDILAICLGKSTYARCGILINITPLEPMWEGQVTIEISNTTPYPAKIYAGEGICQFLFFRASGVCKTSYADRKGKYQSQSGIVGPR